MDAVNVTMVLLTLTMVVVVALGVAAALRRSGDEAEVARRWAWRLAVALLGWLALTTALAATGVLSKWDARPPPLLLLPLTAFVTLVALVSRPAFGARLTKVPPHWLIAPQSFRVVVELALWGLLLEGRAPKQVTFEGRNLDLLVGLAAPVMAWLVVRGLAGRRAIVGWNLVGLTVLANTIITVVTSVPGPLKLDWPGEPFTAPATWPVVWLPAFLAPLAVFFHVSSLRQALASGASSAAAPRLSAGASAGPRA